MERSVMAATVKSFQYLWKCKITESYLSEFWRAPFHDLVYDVTLEGYVSVGPEHCYDILTKGF